MHQVHLAPLWSAVAGVVGLIAVDRVDALSAAGWCTGLLYLCGSNLLLARGLRARGTIRFGPANATTAARSTMVGLIAALVATSSTDPVSTSLVVGLAAPALALDAVDGWVARRTGTISELGARFDMEVDAFLLLVLSVYVAPRLGWWVLTIGVLRYGFAAAGAVWPWMRATLPPRPWRKVVTAVAGIALVLVAAGLAPRGVEVVVTVTALALLLESFGRDVRWLVRRRRRTAAAPARRVGPSAGEREE